MLDPRVQQDLKVSLEKMEPTDPTEPLDPKERRAQ